MHKGITHPYMISQTRKTQSKHGILKLGWVKFTFLSGGSFLVGNKLQEVRCESTNLRETESLNSCSPQDRQAQDRRGPAFIT